MSNPLVSIIIPTYGRPNYLERAIKSALNQSYANVEIIIVDDNQPYTDERSQTEEIVKSYSHLTNLTYIQHIQNLNGSAARNTGFAACRGIYISFLDDDDELLPDKIKSQVDYLNKFEQFDACYCLTLYSYNKKIYNKSTYCRSGNFQHDVFLLNHQCNTSSFLFRKAVLEKLGGFNEEFTRHQDVELLIRFFSYG